MNRLWHPSFNSTSSTNTVPTRSAGSSINQPRHTPSGYQPAGALGSHDSDGQFSQTSCTEVSDALLDEFVALSHVESDTASIAEDGYLPGIGQHLSIPTAIREDYQRPTAEGPRLLTPQFSGSYGDPVPPYGHLDVGSGLDLHGAAQHGFFPPPPKPLLDGPTSWRDTTHPYDYARQPLVASNTTCSTTPSVQSAPVGIPPTPAALEAARLLRVERKATNRYRGPRQPCPEGCGKTLSRKEDVTRHLLDIHKQGLNHFHCVEEHCWSPCSREDKMKAHCREKHGDLPGYELYLPYSNEESRTDGCFFSWCTEYIPIVHEGSKRNRRKTPHQHHEPDTLSWSELDFI